MDKWLMLAISMIACLIVTILRKKYTEKLTGMVDVLAFNAVCSIVSVFVFLIFCGFGAVSYFTLILGIVFGAATAIACVTNLFAFQCGPMSYTTVIISFSTLISALSGVMFFGESLSVTQIVGIALMLASFVLAVKSEKGEKGANLKWLLLSIASFLSVGGIGVMQKVHQSSEFREELDEFLIIAFISSTVLSLLFILAMKWLGRKGEKIKRELSKKDLCLIAGIMVVSGIAVAVNNQFNLYLSGVIDSAVFFPVVNGGGLVLATLAALLIFKEKLSLKQWIGILLGTLSVVLLCNPFGF